MTMNISGYNNNYYYYASNNISRYDANIPTNASQLKDPKVAQNSPTGKIECQTCKNRKYVDGSNDPGVSFKTPGHIDPQNSAAQVMSHEMEHVRNEKAEASSKNREIVSQSVKLQTSTCPECGKVYVSGGTTTTVTKASPDKSDYFKKNYEKIMAGFFGKTIDLRL